MFVGSLCTKPEFPRSVTKSQHQEISVTSFKNNTYKNHTSCIGAYGEFINWNGQILGNTHHAHLWQGLNVLIVYSVYCFCFGFIFSLCYILLHLIFRKQRSPMNLYILTSSKIRNEIANLTLLNIVGIVMSILICHLHKNPDEIGNYSIGYQ